MRQEPSPVKYPHIQVDWSDIAGNAYVLVGSVRRALRKAKIADAEIEGFAKEALSGDYDHVIQTCMAWVTILYTPESEETDGEEKIFK